MVVYYTESKQWVNLAQITFSQDGLHTAVAFFLSVGSGLVLVTSNSSGNIFNFYGQYKIR